MNLLLKSKSLLREPPLLLAVLLLLATSPTWAVSSQCDAVSGNLVRNCGFENGTFADWTQGGNTGFTSVTDDPLFVNSGFYGAQFGPIGSDGTLRQTVGDNSTIYSISFWLMNDGGAPNDFTVYWNGTDIGPNFVNESPFSYIQYTLPNVQGNYGAGSNELTFHLRHDPSYWGLDDVVVVNVGSSIPEPATLALLSLGLVGLGIARRRKIRF